MSAAASTSVHPSAVVDDAAVLEDGVVVGPGCVVGAGVRLGAGTRLIASVVILGPTTLGARNVVHPFAVLGGEPQDRTYAGEPTTLVVGDDNVFREHVTAHRGTVKDHGVTTIGSGGLFMAGSHVAHDCVVGDGVTLANGTLLGGHVRLGDGVVTGGHVAIAPFVRVGRLAFLAGAARVERDVPPFVIAAGDRARVRALNQVGLTRSGFGHDRTRALEVAFRRLFRSREPRALVLDEVQRAAAGDALASELVASVIETRRRGLV